MAFNPTKLPSTVEAAFRNSPVWLWPAVVTAAIAHGVTDRNTLADIIFYMHHRELLGQSLKPHQSKLIAEWKSYRDALSARTVAKAKHSGKPQAELETAKTRRDTLAALDKVVASKYEPKTPMRDEFALVIRIAKLYLREKPIAPDYWQFQALDVAGRPAWDNPNTLKRPPHILDSFLSLIV
jgi:hypothetical protein